jgi:hypothetical protein
MRAPGLVAVLLAAAAIVCARAPEALAQSSAGKPAEGASDQDARKRDAKEKFLQGRDALNRGEYATALILFRTSQDLYPSPGTLLNLALCEERLGMLGSALQHFQEVARLLPPGDDRLSIARNGAAMIEPRVPRLRIEIAKGAPEGLSLSRDGAPLGTADLGKDLVLNPGKHVIVVKAPGRPDRPYEVTLVEGAREVLTVEPGIDPAAAPRDPKLPERARGEDRGPRIAPSIGVGAATPSPDRPGVDADAAAGNPRRTAGFVVGGVGVVSLVVGATTGLLAFSKKSEVDSLCPRSDVCSAEGIAAESTGKSLATASTITVVVGLVAVGAGAALVLTSGGGSQPRPSAAIAPLVLPGGAGLGAIGRF